MKSSEELRELVQPSEFLLKALPQLTDKKKRGRQSKSRSDLLEITELSIEEHAVKQMQTPHSNGLFQLSQGSSLLLGTIGSSRSNQRPKVINDQSLVAEQAQMHREWASRVEAGLSVEDHTIGGSSTHKGQGLFSGEGGEVDGQCMFFGPYERQQVSLLYNACGHAYASSASTPAPVKGTLLDLKRVQDELINYASEEGSVGDWLSIIAKLQQRYLGKKSQIDLEYDMIKVSTDEVMRAIFPLMRSHETQNALDTFSKLWKTEPVTYELTDEDMVDNMPLSVVDSLKSLFQLFDIRKIGYVSSLEVAHALRNSNPTNGFNISVLVASAEIEKLALYFEGDVSQHDSLTSTGMTSGSKQQVVGESSKDNDGDDDNVDDVQFEVEEVVKRKGVDRRVSEVEFILAFRDAL